MRSSRIGITRLKIKHLYENIGAFFIGFWPIFGYKVRHKYP